MLYFARDHFAIGGDRTERANERVDDSRARADDRGTAHGRSNDLRAGLDHHPAVDLRELIDGSLDSLLDLLEQQAVRLEQRSELAGVDPPAVEHLVTYRQPLLDQPLNGIGDLELAALRRR